jgi:hypothetical protein
VLSNPKVLPAEDLKLIRLESEWLSVDVAPDIGGRIVSLIHKGTGHEFLWRNQQLRLEPVPAGSEYDPNFYGGVDELLPNDIPETIGGVNCPDHGELWTTALASELDGPRLRLSGSLPGFGLFYEREMELRPDEPRIEIRYRLTNHALQVRHFLWKLHAAIAIEPGDIIECPAASAQVVDPAWCRFKNLDPFPWPMLDGSAVNVIPPPEGTTDFFYLFDLRRGEMAWRRPGRGLRFAYEFDTRVFPYAWLFASYGGFNGHYTAILEPCTAMPISVNHAAPKRQCSTLGPGESLETRVSIVATSRSQEA